MQLECKYAHMPVHPPYITRSLETAIAEAVRDFPAVVVTGPRQSGKTTVLEHFGGQGLRKVFLEAPDVLAAARADPRGFLDLHPPPVLLDEVQAVPELLPYLKERIDADRHREGQWFLTGSEGLLLAERVGESLAGRAAILHLLPLSLAERFGAPNAAFPWEREVRGATPLPLPRGEAFWSLLLRGAGPNWRPRPGGPMPSGWRASCRPGSNGMCGACGISGISPPFPPSCRPWRPEARGCSG